MTMLRPGCRRRYPGRTALLAEREATEVRPAAAHAAQRRAHARRATGEQQQAERNGGIAYFVGSDRGKQHSESAKPKEQCG